MPRFVLFSFLILAWVFYELSGGSDFVPRGLRPAPEARQASTVPTTDTPPPVIAPRRAEAGATMSTPAQQPPRPDRIRSERAPTLTFATSPDAAKARLSTLGTSLGSDLSDGLTGGLELTSLAQGAAGLHAAAPAPAVATPQIETPPPDLRRVTGLRVNMREGPGTIYPVTARLQLGDEVTVLSESGTGWLRLRVTASGQLGWIAASLISKPAP
ncbi:SH3 domain-containing protein [Pseudodonghicola flavimaris]|uniref:SH3 domain-containing protein n=1 Tax=Pseudodonghicola flavimaris TaxID=3050036 RepID=A0ABT7F1X3_9RHOB|nr:SH3 domain-containing protein [Pseudodonghicola flavimaris]MDK3018607.1 SH3 domain-containing protein [Pseudodonghicola flavimaris]